MWSELEQAYFARLCAVAGIMGFFQFLTFFDLFC